jgi:hypothetical protein
MRDLLVACQAALTILLLAAAGSAMRSFVNVYHAKLGYERHDVPTINLSLPDGNYTTYETRAGFYHAINQRVATLPGTRSSAVALFQIPPGEAIRQTLEIMGRTPERGRTVNVHETTGEYFSTLRTDITPLTTPSSALEPATSGRALRKF